MARRKRKVNKHFVCPWCDQDEDRPVRGIPRVGPAIMICPVCRGPA